MVAGIPAEEVYCSECGVYLGSDYKEGDQCVECWQVSDAVFNAAQNRQEHHAP